MQHPRARQNLERNSSALLQHQVSVAWVGQISIWVEVKGLGRDSFVSELSWCLQRLMTEPCGAAGVQCPEFPRSSVGVSGLGLVAVGGCTGGWDKDPREMNISSTLKSQER